MVIEFQEIGKFSGILELSFDSTGLAHSVEATEGDDTAMDALARLKCIQANLDLMQMHSVAANEESADRFVAEFLLFLSNYSSDAEEMRRQCDNLVFALRKMPTGFFQALAQDENSPLEKDSSPVELEQKESSLTLEIERPRREAELQPNALKAETNPYICTSPTVSVREPVVSPVISVKAMEKARSTFEDFCRTYFMFHGMNPTSPADVFHYIHILYFVESLIYQLDDENEMMLGYSLSIAPLDVSGLSGEAVKDKSLRLEVSTSQNIECSSSDQESLSSSGSSENNSDIDLFRPLKDILVGKGLLTNRIEAEMRDGVEYWMLERKLSRAVQLGEEVSEEDVFRAISLKSFDYRILNFLLYSLTNRPVVDSHVEFLAVAEVLVEIADDLFDYEDDIMKNSFNVLRMLIRACGPTEAPTVLANFISVKEQKYEQLLQNLDLGLAEKFQRRSHEAVREGGGVTKTGSPGSWTLPAVIVDEEAFRSRVRAGSTPTIKEI